MLDSSEADGDVTMKQTCRNFVRMEVMWCHQGGFEINQCSKYILTVFYSDLLILITHTAVL